MLAGSCDSAAGGGSGSSSSPEGFSCVKKNHGISTTAKRRSDSSQTGTDTPTARRSHTLQYFVIRRQRRRWCPAATSRSKNKDQLQRCCCRFKRYRHIDGLWFKCLVDQTTTSSTASNRKVTKPNGSVRTVSVSPDAHRNRPSSRSKIHRGRPPRPRPRRDAAPVKSDAAVLRHNWDPSQR